MSSGAPQLLKESSIGRTTQDVSARQNKLGAVQVLVTIFSHMRGLIILYNYHFCCVTIVDR